MGTSQSFFIPILRVCLFILTISVTGPALVQASAPVVLNDHTQSVRLNRQLEYLEDVEGVYDIGQVSSPGFSDRFKANRNGPLNFGYTPSVYWVRFTVKDQSTSKGDWVLEIAFPTLDRITLFSPLNSGRFRQRKTGDIFPFSEREVLHAHFLLSLPVEAQFQTFYLRVETKGSMQLPMVLHSPVGMTQKIRTTNSFLGLYYGIMLAMFCYNLFLCISLKDRNYLFYLFYILSFTYFQASINGIASELFWPDSPVLADRLLTFSFCLTFLWMVVFARSFLALRDNLPGMNLVFKALIIVCPPLLLLTLLTRSSMVFQAINVITLIAVVSAILSGFLCLIKGFRPARFFLLAWSVFLLSIVISILWRFGLLQTSFLTMYGVQIGSALEVVLLSFALADRVIVDRRAYESSLKNLVMNRTEQLMGKDQKLMQEISARRKSERSFQESEEKYRILVEHSTLAIGISQGDQIVFGNRAILDLLGYDSLEELQQKTAMSFVVPEDREKVQERIQKRAAGESVPLEYENRLLRKDGEVVLVEQVTSEIQIDDETFQLSTLKDISDRKRSEEAMERARQKAEEANRLKSEFLANMSHEIRTPMQGIIGYTNLAIDRFRQTRKDKLLEYFKEISQSGKRLLVLLNNLLDLSKLESGKMEYRFQRESISFLIEFTIREFRALTDEKELSVLFDKPSFDDQVMLDREKITQVIHNLLSNAVKFSPQNSTIHTSLQKKDSFWVVSVRNVGVGIPEEELESIFDKFIQSSATKTGAGGTGLGLAICREIIREHKGRIWAENDPDGGVTFSFILPVESPG